MKFIFILPGKQDKTVRNRGLYNPPCLLRGNKAVWKRRVLFSWHRIAPWALTQHLTVQRTMREQEGQGRPFQGKSCTRPCGLSFATLFSVWADSPSWGPDKSLRARATYTISFKLTEVCLLPVRNPPPTVSLLQLSNKEASPSRQSEDWGTPEGFLAPSALNGHLLLGRLCTLDARVWSSD